MVWKTHRENQRDNRALVPYHGGAESCKYPAKACRWGIAVRWNHIYHHALRQARVAPRYPWTAVWYRGALCIHSYEGAWNANTGNGYYGGMQMDLSFQQAYGPEFYARSGTADHWTPTEQLIASWRAWRVRGWTPWPNTARYCGLL